MTVRAGEAPIQRCLRRDATKQAPERQHESETSERERRTCRLRCRHCGTAVSDLAFLFAADGSSPVVVFANPRGRVFEIMTLLHADNLLFAGASTTEFTWFSGYAWRIALCSGCATHLGWSFVAARSDVTPGAFFGLIRSELVEDPGELTPPS